MRIINKEEAKQKLAELIYDFNNNPRRDNLTEEETRSFISKMFEILGWSFTKGEVTQEEKVSKGYVDYGFKINDIPKMFVDAKNSFGVWVLDKIRERGWGHPACLEKAKTAT